MKQFFFLLLLFPMWAGAQGFTITGNVQGLQDGEVVISSTQNNEILAKGQIKAGQFVVKGAVAEPSLYWLTLGGEEPVHLFLDNSNISVKGTKKEIKKLQITGSKTHEDFHLFRTTFNPLVAELNIVAADMQRAESEKKRDGLLRQYDSIGQLISRQVDQFVAAHNKSFVSPFVLYVTAQLNDDPLLLEQRFQRLDASIQNSAIGKSLTEFIAFNKVGAVGSEALEFTQNDPDGKPVSLSSFRGKYVLVDFWASWCKPCRQENPNVVRVHDKFKNKNFTVLGVSLDQQKDPWVKAIEKDNLKWTQVSDLQFWNNAVATLYHIQSIPSNMLVDPDGKIVAKNLTGASLERKLCELLGCN